MPLPKGPNPGGLPQRPGGGLPQPGGGGLPQPNLRPQVPAQNNPTQRPQQNLPQPPREEKYAGGMDRLSEYDFGAREVDREPLNKNFREAEPELTFDDILGPEEDNSYEDEIVREISERKARETAHRFDRSMEEKSPSKKPKNNVLKPQAGELDSKGQNVFIDKKNKKVEPFGGKKSSIKVNDLDRRKNMRQNATIVKVVVIGLCLVTLGFAAKNAFMPPTGITESDVQSIVYDTTGTTAFPLQQGGFFAESFMEAYLEYDPNNGDSNSIMQYYTTGVLGSGGAVVPGTVYGKNFKQTVINGPVVYNSQEASDNSAIYTVGALVKVENIVPGSAEVPVNNASGAPDGTGLANSASGSLVWKFFAINVYHNSETNAFAIASAPTVVPAPDTIKTSEVPAAAPYGTGEAAKEDAIKAVTPTIYGFLSAYREASPAKPEQLLPFLGSDPDKALLTGLNGGYEFKGGKANEESVTISGWGTGTDAVKAILTVTWVQNVSGSFVETQSSYVMDIQPISGGYRVTRFLPLAYVPEG